MSSLVLKPSKDELNMFADDYSDGSSSRKGLFKDTPTKKKYFIVGLGAFTIVGALVGTALFFLLSVEHVGCGEMTVGRSFIVPSDSMMEFNMSAPGTVCTLMGENGPVARSYDGYAWEPFGSGQALSFDCYSDDRCRLKTPSKTQLSLTSHIAEFRLDPLQLDAKFLTQATFGPRMDETRALKGNYKEWIVSQMAEKPTLHRAYFRERANMRNTVDSPLGSIRSACAKDSRWHRYAFTEQDEGKQVSITAVGDYFELKIDDVPRHHAPTLASLGGNPKLVVGDYTLCTVNESPNGSPNIQFGTGTGDNICKARKTYTNPLISFQVAPATGRLLSGLSLVDLDPPVQHAKLLNQEVTGCDSKLPGPLFGRSSGVYYLFDPRIKTVSNTAEQPFLGTSGSTRCHNAPKTPFNLKHCVVSSTSCQSTRYANKMVTLNEEFIKDYYKLAGKYVYSISGLRTNDPLVHNICDTRTNYRTSRWLISDGACPAGGPVISNAATLTMFQNLLQNSKDKNPLIRDITRTEKCTGANPPLGVRVAVGGKCYTQVHGNLHNVYDFSTWTLLDTHPGNRAKLEKGLPNPITAFAIDDKSALQFPGNHGLNRWHGNRHRFPFVGRLGDVINYADLPTSAQDLAHAAKYDAVDDGASSEVPGTICGSPGEVASDPKKGARYGIAFSASNDVNNAYPFDDTRMNSINRPKQVVWFNIALKAADQLRQRVAWALSQILVVTEVDVEQFQKNEAYLNYYDIFVRHAFGNYRDILREVSWSPQMGRMLSYLNSESYSSALKRGQPSFPDENYAREIMQLFSIGLWELNPDGTQRLDEDGNPIATYDNEDILEFAKTWTGFYLQPSRGNIENDFLPQGSNYIDPMRLRMDFRDPFPKRGLNEHGYIGDRYPLCIDLPKSEFLGKGSTYRFLGNRDSPELQARIVYNNRALLRVVLSENSKLREKLCNNPNGGVTNCQYSAEVTLDESLPCNGLECEVDTVKIVKIPTEPEYCPPKYLYVAGSGATGDTCLYQTDGKRVCPSGCEATNTEDPSNPACVLSGTNNVCRKPGYEADGLYFEYVRAPCTEMTFFNEGVVIARFKGQESLCANPKEKLAAEACCYNEEKQANGYCNYDGEVMTLATANKRCADRFPGQDFGVCEFSSVEKRCQANTNFVRHWTNAACETQVKIGANGKVAVVHDVTNKEEVLQMLQVENENWFRVIWEDGQIPSPESGCAQGACELIEATDTQQASCLCGTLVNETVVFTDLPTREEVLKQLFIGELDPESDAFEVVIDAGNDDVKVFKFKDGELFDSKTVFQVVDNNGLTHSLRNSRSIVEIAGASGSVAGFRNPPKFLTFSNLNIRDATYETDAVIDHFMYHPNTPPFIARLLIQRLVTSNPSPRYTSVVAEAFRTGIFEDIGSGKYGDLAATVAAIYLDREARSDVVDWDPSTGKLREPLMKVVHMMRSLLTNTYKGSEIYPQDIESRVGMVAHRAPTVFSFFQPDLTTDGPVAENSLIIPEATLLQGPRILGLLKTMASYVTYGLQDCWGGFGTRRANLDCNVMRNQRFTVGSNNNRQKSRATYFDNADLATTAEEVLDDLNLLLLGGRLSNYTRDVLIEDYYRMNETHGAGAAIRSTQQLLLMTPEYHTLGHTPTKEIGRPPSGVADVDPSTLKPFKAVVYVNFAGGADSYNLLVPKESCKNDLFEVYVDRRGLVAHLKSEILEIADKDGTQPCEAFGIHPELTKVQELYNADQAVFMANMGPLFEPLNRVNEKGKKQPPSLFAHNTQARFTQTVTPVSSDVGVLGRIRDELHESGYSTASFSISGGNYVLKGVPGVSPVPDTVDRNNGVQSFNFNEYAAENGQDVMGLLNNKTSTNAFGETWASTLHYTMARSEVLADVLENAETSETFGGSSLEQQFQQVAKLINSRDVLKIDRASFYTAIGGFDTHNNAKTTLKNKMAEVNRALTSFQAEMEAKGLWEDTLVVFGSEFARTFTNNGVGTDHGWGGNYFAVGGGLKGGRILGQFPEDLRAGAPLDLGRGRILPTTSWDSPWNAIAQWLGVDDDAALDRVAPNRKNFPNLWKLDDMFDV